MLSTAPATRVRPHGSERPALRTRHQDHGRTTTTTTSGCRSAQRPRQALHRRHTARRRAGQTPPAAAARLTPTHLRGGAAANARSPSLRCCSRAKRARHDAQCSMCASTAPTRARTHVACRAPRRRSASSQASGSSCEVPAHSAKVRSRPPVLRLAAPADRSGSTPDVDGDTVVTASVSFIANNARPRWSRDRTVPTGIRATAAASA